MRTARNERGASLVFTVLGLGVLTVLGLGLTSLGMLSLTSATNEGELNDALAIADAGVGHAKKLILWQEWASFDQFLQRGNAIACDGDELAGTPLVGGAAAYPALPTGYPTDVSQFIPAAGRTFSTGTYRVVLCDDRSTDVDPATGVLNTNPNADVNRRMLVRSTGVGRNGATATIEAVIAPSICPRSS